MGTAEGTIQTLQELGMLSTVNSCDVFGQAISPHHSDHMSKRSQVPRIAPLGCSLMEVHR